MNSADFEDLGLFAFFGFCVLFFVGVLISEFVDYIGKPDCQEAENYEDLDVDS